MRVNRDSQQKWSRVVRGTGSSAKCFAVSGNNYTTVTAIATLTVRPSVNNIHVCFSYDVVHSVKPTLIVFGYGFAVLRARTHR